MPDAQVNSWKEGIQDFLQLRVLVITLLGFSAGLPLLLIFSSLSLWLNEAGVERASLTLFSLAALAYSFKFVWAPVVDRLPIPVLTHLMGIRRSWLLLAQCGVMGSLFLMSCVDPAEGMSALKWMAVGAVCLGFASATQDIVIDAYRIECAPTEMQGLLSAGYVLGYRVGMIASGAGALFLASYFGTELGAYDYLSWRNTYQFMAGFMLVGAVTTLLISQPKYGRTVDKDYSVHDYLRFCLLFLCFVAGFIGSFILLTPVFDGLKDFTLDLMLLDMLLSFFIELLHIAASILSAMLVAVMLVRLNLVDNSMVEQTYIAPVREFFSRYPIRFALILLALISCYRLSDIMLGIIANLFYQDMGFTKNQIASAAKVFGVIMTILGTFTGGFFVVRFGVMKVLLLGAIMVSLTNLLFLLLAHSGADIVLLYIVLGADSLSAGLATAAFITFLSSMTNISFTAMQYAIFSSLMTLFPKVMGSYSGAIVENMGYSHFFILVAAMGIPAILLILYLQKFVTLDHDRLALVAKD